ncbi:MAG: leucine-rich repeat domain-containing protein, partial [Candidatus Methanoplasma sp.]|nr:leucine-rich repeat domain-containing protein [Candidatus Methanoplasma sp.]
MGKKILNGGGGSGAENRLSSSASVKGRKSGRKNSLIAIVAVLAVVAVSAAIVSQDQDTSADVDVYDSHGNGYRVTDAIYFKMATLVHIEGDPESVTVDETFLVGSDTYHVKIIDGAFAGKTSLISLILPGSIYLVPSGEFKDCVNLTNVSVVPVNTSGNTWGYDTIKVEGNGIYVTTPGVYNSFLAPAANHTEAPPVFDYLHTVISGVENHTPTAITTKIDSYAYAGSNVKTVNLSAAVSGFYSVLGSATNPAVPFTGATSLEAINVDPSNPTYSASEGVLFDKTKTHLIKYPQAKPGSTYTMPSDASVAVQIDAYAFSNTSLLQKIVLSLNTLIEAEAFNGSAVSEVTADRVNDSVGRSLLSTAFRNAPTWSLNSAGCSITKLTIDVDTVDTLAVADIVAVSDKKLVLTDQVKRTVGSGFFAYNAGWVQVFNADKAGHTYTAFDGKWYAEAVEIEVDATNLSTTASYAIDSGGYVDLKPPSVSNIIFPVGHIMNFSAKAGHSNEYVAYASMMIWDQSANQYKEKFRSYIGGSSLSFEIDDRYVDEFSPAGHTPRLTFTVPPAASTYIVQISYTNTSSLDISVNNGMFAKHSAASVTVADGDTIKVKPTGIGITGAVFMAGTSSENMAYSNGAYSHMVTSHGTISFVKGSADDFYVEINTSPA